MGLATATVKGGMFETVGVSSLASIQGSGYPRREAAFQLGKYGMLDERQLARTLDGVVPGSTATKQLTRVINDVELGGKRLTELYTFVNRATTAGDVTALNNDLFSFSNMTTYGPSPPVNKDGSPLGERR